MRRGAARDVKAEVEGVCAKVELAIRAPTMMMPYDEPWAILGYMRTRHTLFPSLFR